MCQPTLKDFSFQVPKLLQKGARANPFVGHLKNMVGEYSANRKAGLTKEAAARRAVAVGGTGIAASAAFPADVPTYAPGVVRASAAAQAGSPDVRRSYELMRSLGVAAPPTPAALEATARMLDKVNPEAWARRAVDALDPETGSTVFSLNPDERLEQIKSRLLGDKITEILNKK